MALTFDLLTMKRGRELNMTHGQRLLQVKFTTTVRRMSYGYGTQLHHGWSDIGGNGNYTRSSADANKPARRDGSVGSRVSLHHLQLPKS